MLLNIAKAYAKKVSTHLVEGKHSVVDIPVLHIDLSMRGIRHTINRNLNLLDAFLRSLGANLFFVVNHLPSGKV